ncbi:hypothetical protein ACHWQZ_G015154 [Mnemiopsis leidyi]
MASSSSLETSPLLRPNEEVPGLEDDSCGSVKKPVKMERTVGVLAGAAILFGNCVGAGIFISPRGVYEKTGSAAGGMIVWAVAGLISTLCTLAYAELGTMMQESGGEFVYIKNTYGNYPAFLFSFCNAFLIKPAMLSVGIMTFADYFAALIWGNGASIVMVKSIGASVIVFLAVLNILSSKLIVKFCSFISIFKLIVVFFLLVCGFAIVIRGKQHGENFSPATSFKNASSNPTDYGLAFYFSVFSYSSWNSLNFMTEELKSPTKTLPRAGMLGVTAVTVSYILANISYLLLFNVSGIIDSKTIAMDSGYLAFGRAGELFMCIGLLLSVLGCAGGGLLCVSRIIQSTAEDGQFPSWMARINPTFNTPIPAIIVLVPVAVGVFLFLVTVACVVLPLFSSDRNSTLMGFITLPLGTLFYLAKYYYKRFTDSSTIAPNSSSSAMSNSSVASNSSVGLGSSKGSESSLPFPSHGSYGSTKKKSIVFKNG